MDELRPKASAVRQNRLPNAVVAGDQSLTVAASLFRRGDIFTLDLIVQNQSDHRFEIDRSRFALFDNRGVHLLAMYDWPEGENYGLRSIREFRRDYAHMGRDFEDVKPGRDREGEPSDSREHASKRLQGQSSSASHSLPSPDQQVNSDYSWISDLQFDAQTLVLPTVCELFPKENRAYWAYWQLAPQEDNSSSHVEYPLTATVVIDGKRMLFRFEEPGVTRTAR